MARVVITGGNRGIGLALAHVCAAAGDEVLLGVRNPAGASGLPGEVLALDVSDDGSVAAFAQALAGRPVDILINNAGISGERQSGLDIDFPLFLQTLDINALGPLRVTQALLPNLRQAGAAKVAIVSSVMASFDNPGPDMTPYRASKAAVNKAAQSIAPGLAKDGIALVVLHPGWVRTDMGGAGADIAPEESAAGIRTVIDELTVATTGRFRAYDGSAIGW